MPLLNGWEPELTPADSVLRRFVHAYADRTAAVATAVGGRSQSDAHAAYADPASPFLFDNTVVLRRPLTSAEVAEVVRRAYAFYPPERPWALLSVFPLGDLSGMGLTEDSHPPLMLRPPGPGTAPPLPDGLRIEPVRTAEQIADVDRLLAEGYPRIGSTSGGGSGGGSIATAAMLGDGVLRLSVGYLGGQAVATAGHAINHGLVEVDRVCTAAEYRGRGIGAAMSYAATNVSSGLPAVIIATDEGRPVCESLGYMSIQRITLWRRLPDWSRPL